MVLQQAMAMGCAIITTNIPGPSEVIEENKSGLLVPTHDIEKLKYAIMKLVNNEDLRRQFVEDGLKRVKKLFDRKRMLDLTFQNRLKMMLDM